MDKVRQHETQITVCGLVCNVEVTYEVEDWGSLSRAPQICCGSVIDMDTGHDWTQYCNETQPEFFVKAYKVYGPYLEEPLRAAIFGIPKNVGYAGPPFALRDTILKVVGPTVMDILHNEVCDAVDDLVRSDTGEGW